MGVDDIVTKIFCEDLGPRLSDYRKWGIQTPLMSSVFMIHQPKAGTADTENKARRKTR